MKRVLIVENKLLLGAGLENLLSGEAGFEVVGVSLHSEEELIEKINELHPTTIILDESTYQTHLFQLLSCSRVYQKLRLVIVSANSNLIHIYHKQNFLLTRPNDFFKVLS